MAIARLGAGVRAVIMGKTKSGKTHLVYSVLEQIDSWVIVDSKRSKLPHEPAAWAAARGIPVSGNPADILRHRRLVWQVSERSLRDRGGWNRPGTWGFLWTAALRALKKRGHTVVNFNEGLQTFPAHGTHPEAVEIFTQGAGFDLASLLETQAANWLNTVMLRQAETLAAFRCTDQLDLDVLRRARGGVDPRPLAQLPPFAFAVHEIGSEQLQPFEPLPPPRRRRPVRPVQPESEQSSEMLFADIASPSRVQEPPENGGNVHKRDPEDAATVGA